MTDHYVALCLWLPLGLLLLSPLMLLGYRGHDPADTSWDKIIAVSCSAILGIACVIYALQPIFTGQLALAATATRDQARTGFQPTAWQLAMLSATLGPPLAALCWWMYDHSGKHHQQ